MANDELHVYQGLPLARTIVDNDSLRTTVVHSLVWHLECLDELMQAGCGNPDTQRQMNRINAALLAIESTQLKLDLPF